MFLMHDAFGILNDHDGVVHQKADGEHHAEHAQGVDGCSRGLHDSHGAEKHNGHGDNGNDRRPETLQEEEHDDGHEHDGFHERTEHAVDGRLHKGHGGIGDGVGESLRKELLHALHESGHAFVGFHGIGAFCQLDADGHGGPPVKAR